MRFENYSNSYIKNKLGVVVFLRKGKYNPLKEKQDFPCIELESIEQDSCRMLEIFKAKNQKSIKTKFFKGDVLFGKLRPYLRKFLFSNFNGVCSTEIWALHSSAMLNSYLFYYLQTEYFMKIASTSSGTKMPRAEWSLVSNADIKYPDSIEEMTKISTMLGLIDKRIESQNKIIEDLDTLKKSISLLIFGDNSEIKLNWKLVKLSNVLKERKTYDIKESKYSHATLSKEGIYAKIDRYNRDFLVKDEEKNYKVTHLNDICYNPANLKFGVICLNTYGDAIFSPIYVTYEVRAGNDPYFISQYITNPTFIGHIRKYEQGTVYERMAVSSEDFLKGEINLPTYQVQLYISKIFKSINDKMNLELQVLEKYKEQKKFLLSNMFI